MKKIVFFHSLSDKHLEQLRKTAPNWEIVVGKERKIWEPHLAEAEIWGGWNREAAEWIRDRETPLRWIQNWGAGVNGLPLDELRKKGIILTNASGVHAYPISETVLAMMLSWTRRLNRYWRNQMNRTWEHSGGPLPEMHGKTIGIVGVGAIGTEIARLAKAFRMRVLGVRRSIKPSEHVDRMYGLPEMNDMLPLCDYVVNTLPLTASTRYLFDEGQFALMKDDAFFVNIGRGGTVRTDALVTALRKGRPAGAGLDVFEEEPLPASHPLWEMENVILTPHTSGSTEFYDDRVMDIFIPNLQAYLNGNKPHVNVVDLDEGY